MFFALRLIASTLPIYWQKFRFETHSAAFIALRRSRVTAGKSKH